MAKGTHGTATRPLAMAGTILDLGPILQRGRHSSKLLSFWFRDQEDQRHGVEAQAGVAAGLPQGQGLGQAEPTGPSFLAGQSRPAPVRQSASSFSGPSRQPHMVLQGHMVHDSNP